MLQHQLLRLDQAAVASDAAVAASQHEAELQPPGKAAEPASASQHETEMQLPGVAAEPASASQHDTQMQLPGAAAEPASTDTEPAGNATEQNLPQEPVPAGQPPVQGPVIVDEAAVAAVQDPAAAAAANGNVGPARREELHVSFLNPQTGLVFIMRQGAKLRTSH